MPGVKGRSGRKGNTPAGQVNIRLTAEVLVELQGIADNNDWTIAHAARKLIEEGIEARKGAEVLQDSIKKHIRASSPAALVQYVVKEAVERLAKDYTLKPKKGKG